jgi:hypothetical protein|tara:strand:- start:700 stop:1701 length:1002 start_codon:yes stop_codon:yes gene_type:complete
MLWVDKKYLRLISSRFRNATWKNEDLLNHSCPYCGDSEKNTHKARGYHFVYKDTFFYKCHNCGESKGFASFLKDQDNTLWKQYCVEKFYKKEPTINKTPVPKSKIIFKDDPLKKVGCVKAIDDQRARDYLNVRKVPKDKWDELYYIENCQALSQLDYKYKERVFGNDPRLVIPFYTRQGKLIGVSGRALNNNKLRYLTLKFDETQPLIYGLRTVDYNKRVYVTEGPIDSLFLSNAIAVAGSDFSKLNTIVPTEQAVIVFDNESRNPEIVKHLYQIIEDGYAVCIWPKSVKQKDINDMVLNGQAPNIIEDVINKNKFSGLKAKMALSDWSKVSG